MIFLDTNVFMYAAGKDHPNKDPSIKLLELIAMDEIQVAVNVEVIQEILHRYTHIGEKSQGLNLAKHVIGLIDKIYGVEQIDTQEAIDILEKSNVTSRDAIHAASCKNRGIEEICTYDKHFDELDFLERKTPEELIEEFKSIS